MTATRRVFISYSHDSAEHKEQVLQLSERLRADGVDVTLDQYIQESGPAEGWPRWMDEQLRTADLVLVVCTPAYRRRLEGREEPGVGHGAAWEGTLIYQHIYNAATRNERFVPVLLKDGSPEDVPTVLQGVATFRPLVDTEYELLYRRITGQPLILRGELGQVRVLPSRRVEVPPLPSALSTTAPSSSRRWVVITAGLVVLMSALVFLWMHRLPDLYTVHVTVTDPQGNTVTDAKVTSSLGGEQTKSEQGWQIRIPGASRPEDGQLQLVGEAPRAFQRGSARVHLGTSSTITVRIPLEAATGATVRGRVVDAAHDPIVGVQVVVVGRQETAKTTADGTFSLPAHAADGQQVQLNAHKDGYRSTELWHPAGSLPATLVLEREVGEKPPAPAGPRPQIAGLSLVIERMDLTRPSGIPLASVKFPPREVEATSQAAASWIRSTLAKLFPTTEPSLSVTQRSQRDWARPVFPLFDPPDPLRDDRLWMFAGPAKIAHARIVKASEAAAEAFAKVSSESEPVVVHFDRPGYELGMVVLQRQTEPIRLARQHGPSMTVAIELEGNAAVAQRLRAALRGADFAILTKDDLNARERAYQDSLRPLLSISQRLFFLRQARVDFLVRGALGSD